MFALRTAEQNPASDAPMAVFAMHPEQETPVSVIVVTPGADGKEAEVTDLLRPDSSYKAPYHP